MLLAGGGDRMRVSNRAAIAPQSSDQLYSNSQTRVNHSLCLLSIAMACLGAEAPRQTTRANIDRWMTELSNWGRWGKTDQDGTVNLITPAKRREAAALVKDGISISL